MVRIFRLSRPAVRQRARSVSRRQRVGLERLEARQLLAVDVTTLADSGSGSLRAAIEAVNSGGKADSIVFKNLSAGTIHALSTLPTLAVSGTTFQFSGTTTAITLDGLHSSLHPRPAAPGAVRVVDVVALDKSERGVFVRAFDVDGVAFVGDRERLIDVDGAAVAARGPKGWVILARVRGEGGGVFLYVIDETADDRGRVSRDVRRIRLGGGGDQDDAWLDVAVRPDGRPAAVWFDAEAGALRLYAP